MKSVAIQGIDGSYSEQAARQMLGPHIEIVECHSFDMAIEAVTNGSSDMEVLPVENRIVGRIEPSSTLVERCGLRELDACELSIEHCLIAVPSARFEYLASVSSHPQALRQCGKFLGDNPQLGQVIGADTASCVKAVVQSGNESVAAIGSLRAAEAYCGKVIRENIADITGNWTRFVIIGRG